MEPIEGSDDRDSELARHLHEARSDREEARDNPGKAITTLAHNIDLARWGVELDIRKFFDSVDGSILQEVLRRRVRDGVILRLLAKWLKAGVMEHGAVTLPGSGTPQEG